MPNKVLIIEDNKTLQLQISEEMKKYENLEPVIALSYTEAMKQLRVYRDEIKFALIDLNLPDISGKKVASLVHSHKIPGIIHTAYINEELQNLIFDKYVHDYVLKSNKNSVPYAIRRIDSFLKKHIKKLLVVDDSKLVRDMITVLLEKIDIEILYCEDGEEAYKLVEKQGDEIALVITDYQMPKMDGLELTMRIRSMYNKDEMAIIAASGMDDRKTINNFLQVGANDFIIKPLDAEEVCVKVQSQLESLDLFEMTRDLANKDFLTGAYNRRFFFETVVNIIDKNKRNNQPIAVAMIDIDKFKNINDTYGHEMGDVAIKEMVKVLDRNLRKYDLVARFGGEEFAVVLEDISLEDTKKLFEKIRSTFEENTIIFNGQTISYTVSIGVLYDQVKNIEKALALADEGLYIAKENGRNQVVIKTFDEEKKLMMQG